MTTIRYENSTSTALELVEGDIRNAHERFIVIGREPNLRKHYEQLTRSRFTSFTNSFEHQSELCRAEDRSVAVFRIPYRPRASSRHLHNQINRFQLAVEEPLARAIFWCDAEQIAMVPISCRQSEVVAHATIRIIWDISVAAFFHTHGPMQDIKPKLFRIYCDTDLQPFIDVLDHVHYASLNHGWLFNFEVQCNRAKMKRYLARHKFRYQRADNG